MENLEHKEIKRIISEFGELSVRKLTDKELRVLLAISSNMSTYARLETKNRREGLYSEVRHD